MIATITGILINVVLFGGIVSLLPTQTAVIVISLSPPYLMWVGIIILIVNFSKIDLYQRHLGINQENLILDWLDVTRYMRIGFGIGMIIYYQFFVPNLP